MSAERARPQEGAELSELLDYIDHLEEELESRDTAIRILWPLARPAVEAMMSPILDVIRDVWADVQRTVEDVMEALETAGVDLNRRCRMCGCTELNACEGGCSWVEADLCSACTGPIVQGLPAEARDVATHWDPAL